MDLKSSTKLIESRQTFSDRICDDLSEVLLSYLSFEDKIRFECVSQQFARTVYQKQYELIIDNNSIIKNIDSKSFELLLKKCEFIRSIKFIANIESVNEMIELITKYC